MQLPIHLHKIIYTPFITGSAAQIWWSTAGNNPTTLPTGTPYSILIPDEDLNNTTRI